MITQKLQDAINGQIAKEIKKINTQNIQKPL